MHTCCHKFVVVGRNNQVALPGSTVAPPGGSKGRAPPGGKKGNHQHAGAGPPYLEHKVRQQNVHISDLIMIAIKTNSSTNTTNLQII